MEKEDCLAYLEGDATQATSCETAKALMAKGAKLYDIRTTTDIENMLPGSIGIDAVRAYDHCLETFGENKDATIILYCYSGNRACNLRTFLLDEGYTSIYNIGGYESKKEVCKRMS
jgi:rhodanese-related sulfurtransferase